VRRRASRSPFLSVSAESIDRTWIQIFSAPILDSCPGQNNVSVLIHIMIRERNEKYNGIKIRAYCNLSEHHQKRNPLCPFAL